MNILPTAPPTFIERSHPEYREEHETPDIGLEPQLTALAQQIEIFRLARHPSPSLRAWVREWPGLGSPKTLAKILDGDFAEMNVAAKLPDYRGVLAALGVQKHSWGAEALYDDLGGAQELQLAALRLMQHNGKDRLILIEGGSGSGKTSSIDLLEAGGSVGSSLLRMEADESWKSLRVALRAVLMRAGVSQDAIPQGTGDRMEMAVTVLKRRGRVFLVIDEAHHVSGAVLNLFKTLLNTTDIMLILAGMKTLLQKLRASASEEATQLIQNRLFARISLAGPDPIGTREFLQRRLGVAGGWRPYVCETISSSAVHAGHWSYLRRIVDQLHAAGTTDPDEADLCGAAKTAAMEIA
ncbi:MAG: AAA family ATPase [Verrucomicrobiota bacterium]